ncbi:MAG TPA: hypothetical protein VFY04_00860 [Solirubrobacterales bacterium]|nr:hypothetical protein [Solirubrobacterales bacterium]
MGEGSNRKVAIGVTLISVVAAGSQLLGIDGSLILGLLVVVATLFVFAALQAFKRLRAGGGPRHVQLEDSLRRELPNAELFDCVFSAGDRLRQILHTVLEDDHVDRLKKGLHVRLVVRARDNESMLRVNENLDRMGTMLAPVGIGFESKAVPWEHCMVEGIIFSDRRALVGFYYRKDHQTYTVSNRLLDVDRSRSEADRVLYDVLRRTFGALWDDGGR